MQVDLKSVGNCVVVDSGSQPASTDKRFAIKAATICNQTEFIWSVARESASSPADVDAELVCFGTEAALQSAHHRSRDTGGVPVHPHHCTESLKPEGITKTGKKGRSAVVVNDGLGNCGTEFSHPLR